jgi:hypothetical protein
LERKKKKLKNTDKEINMNEEITGNGKKYFPSPDNLDSSETEKNKLDFITKQLINYCSIFPRVFLF